MRVLLAIAILLGPACADEREQPCRIAVKSLAAAPENRAAGELEKVLRFGRYALPDLEQELHTANLTGRKRLLEAVRRLHDREALPFLDTVARWDQAPEVRALAAEIANMLRNATR